MDRRILSPRWNFSRLRWKFSVGPESLREGLQMKTWLSIRLVLVVAGGVVWAEVKATQTETGVSRTVNSGADGGFVFTNLPTGPYQIEVTKQGFSKAVQS